MRSVEVFEIGPFFERVSGSFESLAYILLVLFMIIVLGIHALKHFTELNLETKLYNFLITIVLISAWPIILFAVKDFVDAFNGFLIFEVFELDWEKRDTFVPWTQFKEAWEGFGGNVFTYPLKVLNLIALLGLVVSRQVIYGLFLVFFFFLAALGPLIIAKTVFSNEVDGFVELMQETVVLLLWQTTYVIILGLLYVGGQAGPYIITNQSNVFFQSAKVFGIIILTFLIPPITRKYGNHLGTSFFPVLARYGGIALAASAVGRVFRSAGRAVQLGGVAHLGQELSKAKGRAERLGSWLSLRREEEREPGEGAVHPELPIQAHPVRGTFALASTEDEQKQARVKVEVQKAKAAIHSQASQIQRLRLVIDSLKQEASSQDKKPLPSPPPPDRGGPPQAEEDSIRVSERVLEPQILAAPEKESQDKKREKQRKLETMEAIRKLRGPVGSRKFEDLERVGVRHIHLDESSGAELKKYRRQLWLFDFVFGERYNSKGELIDLELGSPSEKEFKDATRRIWGEEER